MKELTEHSTRHPVRLERGYGLCDKSYPGKSTNKFSSIELPLVYLDYLTLGTIHNSPLGTFFHFSCPPLGWPIPLVHNLKFYFSSPLWSLIVGCQTDFSKILKKLKNLDFFENFGSKFLKILKIIFFSKTEKKSSKNENFQKSPKFSIF